MSLGKIRKEEDVIWSFAPHDISMILSLIDKTPVESVYASGNAVLQDKISDIAKIEKNKTVGLLGPNGCGKTTSIGMILGLIEPSEGEIKLALDFVGDTKGEARENSWIQYAHVLLASNEFLYVN